ncbi:MAG: hypothetical protein AMXMBFR4_23870 [Candidatus Hydrogenedentota bacterium]
MFSDVRIFDTTLRDGDQTPGVHYSPEQKVEIAKMLAEFGVATVEAGFPASSPAEQNAVAGVAREIRSCEVAALARCIPGDVDAAVDALRSAERPVIHVFLGSSDVHLSRKLGMSRAEALRAIDRSVRRAKNHVADVEYSAEDATRADRVFLRQCVETAIGAGATRVNLPDTVGCAMPSEYGAMIAEIVRFVEGAAIVSAHCHDDMGLATANTVAAVQAGARQVEVTVNGIGERAGNASLEQVAVILAMKGIAQTGLDLSRTMVLSQRVAEATGIAIQPNRPIIGANAFAHASGIHQDGIIKEVENYQYVPPFLVGAGGHRLVLTARSGRKAVAHKAAALGFKLDESAVDRIYKAFIEVADSSRGGVSDTEFAEIVNRSARVSMS